MLEYILSENFLVLHVTCVTQVTQCDNLQVKFACSVALGLSNNQVGINLKSGCEMKSSVLS